MECDESFVYGRYDCKFQVGDSLGCNFYLLSTDPKLSWLGGRSYGSQVSFSLIKDWTRSCVETHERCGSQSLHSHIKDISLLRFVDVEDMCLVDSLEGSQFIALSYVCGTAPIFKATLRNKTQLYSKLGLSRFMDEISTTIQDEIQVAREIGMRYLWTDAICIIQDDWEEKKQLIGSMDAVYAQATLTIFAAQGRNANAGLPGVRPGSKNIPRVFEYSPEAKFQVAATPLPDMLLGCPWSRRGWKYQEGLLSARIIVFTNDAVHFACNSTCWSEDLKSISETIPPPWKFASGSQYNFRSTLTELGDTSPRTDFDPLTDLWQTIVGEISERTLSYESDILYVGASMFGLLESILGVKSLWGIPESRMEEFLFWSPIYPGSLRRRKGDFPSWSWCGWVGEVSWLGGSTEKAASGNEPIKWMKVEILDGKPLFLDKGGRGKESSESQNGKEVPKEWLFLQFESRVYTLRISKNISAPEWGKELLPYACSYVPENGQERQGVYCITTRDDPERVVGSVILDFLNETSNEDFIDARFAIVSSEPEIIDAGDFAGQEFLNVLALSFEGVVYQRIGHGRMMNEFVLENPSEREKILLN